MSAGKNPVKGKTRACYICRRLKRRCDGGVLCNQCNKHNVVCTYLERAMVRTVEDIPDSGAYLDALKFRLATTEEALFKARQPTMHFISGSMKNLIDPVTSPHLSPDSTKFDIAASFQALSLDGKSPDPGYQGESSAAMLVKVALSTKSSNRPPTTDRRAPASKPWALKPWDDRRSTAPHPALVFPDHSLTQSLVSLYFSNLNLFIPVLHRHQFERCVAEQLHMRNDGFALTLLLVCALGSLYLPINEDQKLAWNWYDQVKLWGHSFRRQPTTYDLQAYCLAGQFLLCTSSARSAWYIVGFGLQQAQDMGAHRRMIDTRTIDIEGELEKRATLGLMMLDTQLAAALGRSMALSPFDLDINPAAECDDEHWTLSGPGLQPPETPSTIAFFNCLLNLYRILHFTLKNLWSSSRHYTASGIEDLQPLAVELDSTLGKWFRSIPPHLGWGPHRTDTLFFDQSASLHCFHSYSQILIHRPFVPAKRLKTQPDLRALRTCLEAARRCITIADIHRRRRPDNPLLFSQNPIFTAAMMLILNMWGRAQRPEDRARDLAHVRTAVDVLKSQEQCVILERLIVLYHIPEEEPDEILEELDSVVDSESYTTAGEVLGPESWVILAQAWMKVARPPMVDAAGMPLVLVGDPDIPSAYSHWPHATLNEM
ncbi:fungal-specific transcription factor domain-containing protein [Mycena metata]|uniref:Fungal-specific transcription factor domain-containing protein n=1 Tax=Mycena metata TaxID=1033252 RepID=A0AAD7HYH4_9AGAR|nr:fungal-specific transcription factor domain-containing protein [Mycena metata]